jgi:hypothetical protein
MKRETGKLALNIGGLAKPATALIDKISSVIGAALYEPTQIRREATAEAEAAKLRAVAKIEVSDIEQRAIIRMVREEGRMQGNIESITLQATTHLNPEADPTQLKDDWISTFFEKSRRVSDVQMQELWSKVLAGETNTPQSFSRRTLEVLSVLEKSDAEVFEKLANFVWLIGRPQPMVFDLKDDIYRRAGVTYVAVHELVAAGLVHYHNLGTVFFAQREPFSMSYAGTKHQLSPQNPPTDFPVGSVDLTLAGQQIFSIIKTSEVEGFADYSLKYWSEKGFTSVIRA